MELSRPYQIALAAIAVLALAWFAVLRGHGSGSDGSSAATPSISAKSATPSPSPTASAEAREAAKPSHVYKGPAPGVEGLTRDVAKAHGAVATSQRNAAELQRKSAQASGEAPAAANGGAGAAKATHAKASTGPATAPSHSASTTNTAAATNTPSRPAQQVQIERELTHGKTVVLVFWNPSASVDQTVRSQALTLAGASKGRVTVHTALAKQVGLFGPVTEVAHVYETPTVLIVARRGLVSTLTGLIDSYGLQQAVREAEHASK